MYYEHFLRFLLDRRLDIIERHFHLPAAAFTRHIRPRVVHQNLPHGHCRDGVEMIPVLEFHSGPGQLDVRFVDQCGGLESMVRILAAPDTPGDLVQFLIDEGHHPVQGILVPPRPSFQMSCDFACVFIHAAIDPRYPYPNFMPSASAAGKSQKKCWLPCPVFDSRCAP